MAWLSSLAQLFIAAVFVLRAADGLLLQKHASGYLNDGESRYSAAQPYFTKSLKSEVERFGKTTPSPDDYSTTTESPMLPEGSGVSGSVDESSYVDPYLAAVPVNVALGYVSRSTELWTDYFDLVPVAAQTLSDKTGVVITQFREGRSSSPTGTLRLFKKGGKTSRICDSNKPLLRAGCGDHYLFPGYNVILEQVRDDCDWRFRHSAPEVLVTLNGVKRYHGLEMSTREVDVPASLLVTSEMGERVNLKTRKHVYRDLMFTLPTEAKAKGISVEVCVPASSKNEKYAEYETHEWGCCANTFDSKCGVPEGSIDDSNFSMKTMPWEAVLAVTVKSTTPGQKYATSYCSGSLISEEWILTTASCFIRPEKKHPGSTPLVTVSFDIRPEAEKHYIAEYIMYPTATEDHDVALVRMAEKTSRRPVCLPGYSKPDVNEDIVGQGGIVFGWIVEGVPHTPPYMATLKQQVIDSDECSRRLGKKLPPHMLCTLDETKGKPCLADGELLTGTDRFTLRGVSTPRLVCSSHFRPHSSVAHFMPWIANVTGITMPF